MSAREPDSDLDPSRGPASEDLSSQPASTRAPSPSLIEVLVAFATIALCGFGGVLYWSRRMVVEQRKWMTPEEFNEVYALCNSLPGGNIVNFSVVFGRRARGLPGALAALTGLIGPPVLLMITFGFLYATFGSVPALQRMLGGVAAAAAGLSVATGLKMAGPLLRQGQQRQRPGFGPLLALAALVAVGVLRWPIYWVIGVLVPVGIVLALWRRL
jgi:chromate transporter